MYGPRRRRLSPWWWLAAVIVLLVGAALLVNSLGTRARREAAFLDATRTLSNEVVQLAAGFDRLVGADLLTVTRPDFEALTTRLGEQLNNHLGDLAAVDTPESTEVAGEILGLALESWSSGVDKFRSAVASIADDPASMDPVDDLGVAIVLLRIGDLLYGRFLDRVAGMVAESDVAIGGFPSIVFVSDRRDLSSATGLARAVRDNAEIGVRRDVAILQIVFEPLPSGSVGDGGEIIFPATELLWFSAVIRNLGSVDQEELRVAAEVRSADGAVGAIDVGGPVDLAAGETGTVEFPPFAVLPGTSYEISFDLSAVDDEVELGDNGWESAIRINPSG